MSKEKKAHTQKSVTAPTSHAKGAGSVKNLIAFAVIIAFLGFVLVKVTLGGTAPTEALVQAEPGEPAATTITTTHNDSVADYEAALKTGKPVYVLFHSLTCDPCIEISEVADNVIPDYEGTVVFVNAITGDPSGEELAAKFSFQYIPQSFFLAPDGTVSDSFNGALDETQMRSYLDALVAAR